jgi:TPR repeat protein
LQREAARKGSEEGALDARGLYSYLVLIGEGLKKPYPSSPEPQFKEAAGLAAQTLSKIPDDPWATLTRAVILMDGLGAPRDLNQGFSLLNGSARNGNPVALHKLGLFYANGSPPVTQNFVAARSFFTQALDRGHVNSAWPLGLLEWRGGAGPANRKRAMELWSMCAKVGHEDCAKAVSQGHP